MGYVPSALVVVRGQHGTYFVLVPCIPVRHQRQTPTYSLHALLLQSVIRYASIAGVEFSTNLLHFVLPRNIRPQLELIIQVRINHFLL